jgi:octaheme c-type cytochrome (tetrathionate reductase family)
VLVGGYQAPIDCLICHENIALNLLDTGHWRWQGVSVNIAGHETETHGKRDLINSFFIGVPSNEARCSQCHPSFGWRDRTFDFNDDTNIDCFICHDTTDTYRKLATADGGGGEAGLLRNGEAVPATPSELQPLIYTLGTPVRRNCGQCHFYADGGDNVKHGDMSSDLTDPTRDLDVHMGGLGFACQTCHGEHLHGIAGFSLHSVNEGGDSPVCTRCHSATAAHTRAPTFNALLNLHLQHLACELCHIPTFARSKPTLVGWYWDSAGQDMAPIPLDQFGQPTYAKDQGTLVWGRNVQPAPRWFNGKWRRKIVGAADTFVNAGTVGDPVVLAEPVGTSADPNAKIYPFKIIRGRQPADTVNRRLIVPHLFGDAAGPSPYWTRFNWMAAIREGAAYSGVPFSGVYGFPETIMYLRVSHEVPPKEQALTCFDCHATTWFWSDLGIADPLP